MRRLLPLVSVIVLLDTVFFAALAPLLPHYAEQFGLSKAESGYLSAIYALGAFAGAIPSGLIAVRLGVKQAVLAGLAVMVLTSIAFGLAGEAWILYAARFGQGVGSALSWTGGLAWLAAATTRDRRGEVLGVAMGAAVAGALFGPVLGGAGAVFGTAAAFTGVAALGAVLVLWAWATPAYRPREEPQALRSLARATRDRTVLAGLWLVSLPAVLLGIITVLGPLRLDTLGWSAVGVSAAFLVSAGAEAVANPLLGRWSDRRGRLAPVRATLFATVAVALVLPWVEEPWTALVLVGVASFIFGLYWVPGTALLSDGAEAAGLEHGFGFALLNVAWAPANVVGAAAAGLLAERAGDAAVYGVVVVLCLATLAGVRRAPLDHRAAAAKGSL